MNESYHKYTKESHVCNKKQNQSSRMLNVAYGAIRNSVEVCVVACGSVLQCIAVRRSALQCVAALRKAKQRTQYST